LIKRGFCLFLVTFIVFSFMRVDAKEENIQKYQAVSQTLSIIDDSYKEVYGIADDDLYYYFWTGSGILKISKNIFEEESFTRARAGDGYTIDLSQYSSEDYRFINCFTSSIQEKDIKGIFTDSNNVLWIIQYDKISQMIDNVMHDISADGISNYKCVKEGIGWIEDNKLKVWTDNEQPKIYEIKDEAISDFTSFNEGYIVITESNRIYEIGDSIELIKDYSDIASHRNEIFCDGGKSIWAALSYDVYRDEDLPVSSYSGQLINIIDDKKFSYEGFISKTEFTSDKGLYWLNAWNNPTGGPAKSTLYYISPEGDMSQIGGGIVNDFELTRDDTVYYIERAGSGEYNRVFDNIIFKKNPKGETALIKDYIGGQLYLDRNDNVFIYGFSGISHSVGNGESISYDGISRLEDENHIINYSFRYTLPKIGQPITKAARSTARVFINSIEIPCIDILGGKCIMIKDLKRCGFQADWDAEKRMIYLEREDGYIDGSISASANEGITSDTQYDVLYTDIRAYILKDKHYYQIPSFNIDGNTAICIGSLELLGNITCDVENDQISIDVP